MTAATAETSAYPRPKLLVEPEWLAQHLDDQGLVIIDCDPAQVSQARAHVPGAQAFPLHPYFRNWETGVGVVTAEQAEQVLRGLGINNDTRVIYYDSDGGLLAARVWWVAWYYGHENGALLNGGWPAWEAAGLPATTEWATNSPGSFSATTHAERIASCDTMLPGLGGDELLPLDVRAIEEWSGEKPAPNPTNRREGRIPGAVHIEWKEFVDEQRNKRFKPADWIRQRLETAGVTRDKRVVPY